MRPLEALRQAQLYALRNPKAVLDRARELAVRVKDEAGLRGIARKAALLPTGPRDPVRSHPAWWAAFVLSGEAGGER